MKTNSISADRISTLTKRRFVYTTDLQTGCPNQKSNQIKACQLDMIFSST